jgi:hypothetical protein
VWTLHERVLHYQAFSRSPAGAADKMSLRDIESQVRHTSQCVLAFHTLGDDLEAELVPISAADPTMVADSSLCGFPRVDRQVTQPGLE